MRHYFFDQTFGIAYTVLITFIDICIAIIFLVAACLRRKKANPRMSPETQRKHNILNVLTYTGQSVLLIAMIIQTILSLLVGLNIFVQFVPALFVDIFIFFFLLALSAFQ
jgi:heme/copper-type cytochrome/quinol oxidase subunit 2